MSNQLNQGTLTKISFGDFCRPRHSVKTWKSWANFSKSTSNRCSFTPARKKNNAKILFFLVFIWCKKTFRQLKNMANSDIRSTGSGWTYFRKTRFTSAIFQTQKQYPHKFSHSLACLWGTCSSHRSKREACWICPSPPLRLSWRMMWTILTNVYFKRLLIIIRSWLVVIVIFF